MTNLRAQLLPFASSIARSKVYNTYRATLQWDRLRNEELHAKQKSLLEQLVIHAFRKVPYYREKLQQAEIINGQGDPQLHNFGRLPPVTKETLRSRNSDFAASDWKERRGRENTSGGSTGEPVRFIQDEAHRIWCVYANKLYFNHMLGKEMGEPEINLWGSERDIQRGSIGVKQKLVNLAYNRYFLNAFRMTDADKRRYLEIISQRRPKTIWAYVESMDELARYAEANGIEVRPPQFIITTAGTLYAPIRNRIERVFGAPVYNQYGSREVGPIACQCTEKNGLHLFPWTHLVEILDERGEVCPPGTEGDIVVTNLVNYAMPLIRYRIGDRGVMGSQLCSCGRTTPVLEKVAGRVIEHLIASDGAEIHGQYIIHLFYNKPWIKRFQVHQRAGGEIVNRIVPVRSPSSEALEEIRRAEKQVLGSCEITFELTDDIPPSPSGKFLYIYSEMVTDRA